MDATRSPKVLPTRQVIALVRHSLDVSGQAYVRVTGDSMRPLLRHLRDGVILVPPWRIRRGDIVLFDRQNGRCALHRVLRAGKTGFTMAGDAQWHLEENLPYGQIVGVVSCIDRGGRKIPRENLFLKMYTFVVTPVTFLRIKGWRALKRLLKPDRNAG